MKNKLSILAAVSGLFILFTASQQVLSSCKASLNLCVQLIIPSLFPFFIISGILNALGFPFLLSRLCGKGAQRIFHVSGAGFSAFILGILGGYPLGAAAVCQMLDNGTISDREAEKLLTFCNNSGPAFVLGAVGAGVFNNPEAGLLLYAVHILSALLTGFLLRGKERFSAPPPQALSCSFSQALSRAVPQAVINILNVCGFVVCFGVFTGLLESGGFLPAVTDFISSRTALDPSFLSAMLRGMIELGSGVGAMAGFELCPANLALAAFLLGFGGLCVHFQTLALLGDKNINSSPFFTGCCLKAVISSILAYFGAMLL